MRTLFVHLTPSMHKAGVSLSRAELTLVIGLRRITMPAAMTMGAEHTSSREWVRLVCSRPHTQAPKWTAGAGVQQSGIKPWV
jgi:hypothetical protein